MPLFVIPFPAFDPVLVKFGPFAVRWYALSYICGILLGWLYARALIRTERLWGGPAPLTLLDFDDFVIWVTLGIILGGRAGYVLFYNLPHFATHPAEIFELWKGGMSFHGGFTGCVLAVVLFARKRGISILSLGDLTCAAGPIGICLGRIANFINGELWGRPTDVPWAMVFPGGGSLPRHPSQLYEATLEGLVLFVVLALLDPRRARLQAAGLHHRRCSPWSTASRASLVEFFREPDAQLGFLWQGMTMGMLLSVPLILTGIAFIVAALKRSASCARPWWETPERWPKPRSKTKSAIRITRSPDRCRCGNTCRSALAHPASSATTRRAIRSAAPAISLPRRKSTRCSAS